MQTHRNMEIIFIFVNNTNEKLASSILKCNTKTKCAIVVQITTNVNLDENILFSRFSCANR